MRRVVEKENMKEVELFIIFWHQRYFKDKDASVVQKETRKPFAFFSLLVCVSVGFHLISALPEEQISC